MKHLIFSFMFLLASCSTTEFYVKKGETDFKKIVPGKTYWFYDTEMKKTVIKVATIDIDSIYGTKKIHRSGISLNPTKQFDEKNYSIAKKDIVKIKKPQPAGTAAIIVGGAGAVALMTYYLTQFFKVYGELVGGIH